MSKRKPHSKPDKKSRRTPRGEKKHHPSRGLPEIGVLTITEITEDGDLIGQPVKWDARQMPPHIVVTETGRGQAANVGDRVLAKLRKIKPQLYQALIIKILPTEQPKNIIGIFVATADGGVIEPVSRKLKESFMVARADTMNATHGELVSAVTQPGVPSMSMEYAKITEILGSLDSPKAASLIAASMHSLPSIFSKEALEEAATATAPTMEKGRTDLRNIPLVTIDGEDARDFDDAVFAEADGEGFHLLVAIADVAHYVRENSALDIEAMERGNSVYFPDRVIPMLPERLSNGLCSLNPNEDRYCLAVHIWIDKQGIMKRYQFVRGLMRSAARLTYTKVEEDQSNPLIRNLYAAYAALASERDTRGALDLDLPEYKILFDDKGHVKAISPRERLESHRLIETFMIAANVAAADYLLKHKAPGIYRVHEEPSEEKLGDLRNLLKMSGYSLHVGAGIKPGHFNRVLKSSTGKPEQYMVHTSVLRSQMQAYYAHENLGHFGLGLQKYAHFTSPIRRYADLVVHRSLSALIAKEKYKPTRQLEDTCLHISETERRAMLAERDAADRYKVSFMSRHIGDSFAGTISGLNEYGLFVSLNENGVTGFVPTRNLSGDFFVFDKRHSCFKGQRSKETYQLGQQLDIRIQSANAITGSLIFELMYSGRNEPLRPPYQSKKHRGNHKKKPPKSRNKKRR